MKDDTTKLRAFTLRAKEYFESITDFDELQKLQPVLREEGGEWNSENMYLITLQETGVVFFHGKDSSLDGFYLREVEDDMGTKVGPAILKAAAMEGGGFFEYYWDDPEDEEDQVPKTCYAIKYWSELAQLNFIVVAGFYMDLAQTLSNDDLPSVPSVTAADVVDRETLKAFVDTTIAWLLKTYENDGLDLKKIEPHFRREGGPWKRGSTYIFVITTTGYVVFHGADPYRQGTSDWDIEDINGVKIVQELIKVSQEGGGYVVNRFDDPDFEGDEEIGSIKVSYAKSLTVPGEIYPGQVFVVGAGFYRPEPDFDGDGNVGFGDFVLFARHFGSGEGDEGFDEWYDLDANGAVDFQDFLIFARDFGKTVTYN